MNKILKSILCVGVCGTMLFATACKPDPEPGPTEKRWDSETRTLRLSTSKVDGNFNPFFYTAQPDGNMIANTQIGMLTINEAGELVAGENYPTAVLDYKYTMYTTREQGTGVATDNGNENGRTEYEFVIKNGIKFSNGEPLTIADVLFNLYVYLDPVYTGSNTIYSTNIQGLKAYRTQTPGLDDDATLDDTANFVQEASRRVRRLVRWAANDRDAEDVPENDPDLARVREELKKELEQDWNSMYSSWRDTYKDTHRFEYAWQAYLYEHQLISDQRVQNGNRSSRYFEDIDGDGVRDESEGTRELYYTTLDPWQIPNNTEGGLVGTIGAQDLLDEINPDEGTEDEVRQRVLDYTYDFYSAKGNIDDVLSYWQTGNTILELFTNEARSEYFRELREEGRGVDSISGISSSTVSGATLNSEFHGDMNQSFVDGDTYSVLKIVINGVDPKAIYNFSYSVSPLSYYSVDDSYDGTDYIAEAMAGTGHGLLTGDTDFFQEVLQDPDKIGLPVGAGPYKAADMNGNPTSNMSAFRNGTIISFVRNEYFETLGSGVNNAKIKNVQYKELQDDEIMSSLTTDSIDFGMPSATPTNITTLSNYNFLHSDSYDTGGYGYVGVNPKFVPEVYVRQAIMKAMQTSSTVRFYGTEYASQIYRPMSRTSWAYPRSLTSLPDDVRYEADNEDGNAVITSLVEAAGYRLVSGVYTKQIDVAGITNAPIGTKLSIPFTIAGETTNHPAYRMFVDASNRLNRLGFDITVKTSTTALRDLATGNMEVWAAAWTSSIDPDPYQVYHMDSTATSPLNWGYAEIKGNQEKWSYEYNIVETLSRRIEEGRAIIGQNRRTQIYADCLDLIMELAVELPTYQRRDLCVFNTNYIDANTLVKNPSYNMGLFDKLWEIDYV